MSVFNVRAVTILYSGLKNQIALLLPFFYVIFDSLRLAGLMVYTPCIPSVKNMTKEGYDFDSIEHKLKKNAIQQFCFAYKFQVYLF